MIKTNIQTLREHARELRIDILKMLNKASSGHTGGSLSAVDIITTLYLHKMKHDPKRPEWKDRDRFVLSKGHGAPALYATLARSGYFDREELFTLRKLGSSLQGHPCRISTPGVEVSTGSLGQGLSMANGIALALKLDAIPARVYCLLGDGEVQEGQVWEAAMSSAHFKLDNICAIVDKNGLQIDGSVEKIMTIDPLAEKFISFGWNVLEIDGHDYEQIISALDSAEEVIGKPTVVIAKTIKGKGVSFFENKYEYHGVAPTDDELERALKELES